MNSIKKSLAEPQFSVFWPLNRGANWYYSNGG